MSTDLLVPESLQHRLDKKELDESIVKAKGALLNDIKRSVYIYRVDCGGCNACEIEIFATITPVFDAERFGIKNMASPRHADILVYTGAVTRSMRMPAIRAYEAAPDPKLIVSYGACGCTGGIFYDNYCVWGGTDKLFPVDVYIPGCPPSPAATVYGFAIALGLLGQKLKNKNLVEAAGEQSPLRYENIPYALRVQLEQEARKLSGYLYGGELVNNFMDVINTPDIDVLAQVDKLVETQEDPRRIEVYLDLKKILMDNVVSGQYQKRGKFRSPLQL